ncbi:hypothetical protein M422DRAFT_245642, partial [Sphaerobolus stellatus SS14]
QKFAPLDIDHLRVLHFIEKAHVTPTSQGQRVIDQEDVAEERIELETQSPPLGCLYSEIARAEFAMVLEIFGFGKDREVAMEDVRILLEEERFPPGWKPTHVIHLRDAMKRSSKIRGIMNQRKKDEQTVDAHESKTADSRVLEILSNWWQHWHSG